MILLRLYNTIRVWLGLEPVIPLWWLFIMGACRPRRRLFRRTFGRQAEVTVANFRRAEVVHPPDLSWLVITLGDESRRAFSDYRLARARLSSGEEKEEAVLRAIREAVTL